MDSTGYSEEQTRDASDWFSPILVKELRQGTRSRAFVWSFLALHTVLLLLIITALLTAASPHSNYDQVFVTGFFWTLISIPLLLVLPGIGFGGLKKELDAKTLELIFLTRMTTLRIVFGKWAALVIQGFLFVSAILPYMILRYFLGGVNLVDELRILLLLMLGSLCLTAAAVGLSSITSKAFRLGIIIAVLFFLIQGLFTSMAIFYGARGLFMTFGTADGWSWLFLFFSVPLFIILMLEFGAGRIAPPAENHALRKRLTGLVLLAGGIAVYFGTNGSWWAPVVVAIPLLIICIEAVNENLRSYGILLRARRAQGKRFAAPVRFLAPGWPGGVIFTALVTAVYLALLLTDSTTEPEHILALLTLSGAILLPVALIRLAAPDTERGFVFFVLIQVIMLCAGICALVFAETTYFAASGFFELLPIPLLMLMLGDHLSGSTNASVNVMVFVNAISLVALLATGMTATRRTVATTSSAHPGQAPQRQPLAPETP